MMTPSLPKSDWLLPAMGDIAPPADPGPKEWALYQHARSQARRVAARVAAGMPSPEEVTSSDLVLTVRREFLQRQELLDAYLIAAGYHYARDLSKARANSAVMVAICAPTITFSPDGSNAEGSHPEVPGSAPADVAVARSVARVDALFRGYCAQGYPPDAVFWLFLTCPECWQGDAAPGSLDDLVRSHARKWKRRAATGTDARST